MGSSSLPTIGDRNTYDVRTGTYTDAFGNKMSTASPPAGARQNKYQFLQQTRAHQKVAKALKVVKVVLQAHHQLQLKKRKLLLLLLNQKTLLVILQFIIIL
jgi:hypothetical protein